jgi:hypothetical protein
MAIVPINELEVNYYKEFSEFLQRYEETNVKKAKPSDPHFMQLLSGDSKVDLKQKLVDNASTLRNPFKHVRNWIKADMLEIQCIIECISRKEGVEANSARPYPMSRITRTLMKRKLLLFHLSQTC